MTRPRLAIAVVACALFATAAGCGDDDDEARSSDSGDADASAKQVSIAFEQVLTGVPFAVVQAAGAKAAAEEDGHISLKVSGPPTVDPVTAQKQASDLLATSPDGFAVTPFPPELWLRTMKTITDRTDGQVIAVDVKPVGRPNEVAGSSIQTFVGDNDSEQAATVATQVIELGKLGPDTTGSALIGQCVPGNAGPLYERTVGFSQVIKERLPKVSIKVFDSKVDPQGNTATWRQTLQANPNPALAVGTCDQDGSSLAKVLKGSGVPAGGLEDPPETLAGLKDGTLLVTATINRYLEGYLPIKLLADSVRGVRPLPKGWIDIGYTVVTKDNVDEIIKRNSSAAETSAWYAPKIKAALADAANPRPMEDAFPKEN